MTVTSCNHSKPETDNINFSKMMVRIAEIEVDSMYFEEYQTILIKESEASLRLEDGVIAIFPMFETNNRSKFKLLEIYANQKAYESHLQTPHFIEYKTSTGHMVKSLKLIDMSAIDPASMTMIFSKLNR
jgi:quinol monooxygenase YgiN